MTQTILNDFKSLYEDTKAETLSVGAYLEECRTNKLAYATAAERMLAAIGEPDVINTTKDQRLSRLFGNRVIKKYKPFEDFYGMEDTIESVVNYFRHNAQGLEESKQLLYLLGPVGGGKSSLVERIKELAEKHPIYVLGYIDEKTGEKHMSPYLARPLSLFSDPRMAEKVSAEYKIDRRYLKGVIGPWETKRLREFDGDINKFCVFKVWPSRQNQIAIASTEPGDENTQDVSTLVGKVDIRKLEDLSQNDADAYLYSGGLNLSNQGLLDFREMFKAKIKMLNPLLFAVQEHNYQGTENFGAIPYDGIVLAHSNEAEWAKFRGNKDNEAFLDRICIVKVPYCLRIDEEKMIYKKFVASSDLKDAPVAPGTLEMMANFSVLTRLNEPENSNIWSKMRVYNGENLRETDNKAKTLHEYRDDPENRNEGFNGISTRWSSKRLSQCFNADPNEIAANPVHLMRILKDEIAKSDLPEDTENLYMAYLNDLIKPKYLEFLDKEIRTAYLESYAEYGQNLFDRYVLYATNWVDDTDHFNPDTGEALDKDALNIELEKIEKAAEIPNPKDFRNEVVRYCLRYAKEHEGRNPDWRTYEKLRVVIEKRMFSQTDDLLPVISYDAKGKEEDRKKHSDFVKNMRDRGYTEKQVRILVDWYMQVRKTS